MSETRKPRERGETFVGRFMLIVAVGLAVLGAYLKFGNQFSDDVSSGMQWFLFAWIEANAAVFLLWGTAILHGGFEGRRYVE